MNANKVTELDVITTKPMKVEAAVISHSLARIINMSISSGKFIDYWKVTKVIPLYKSADSL